MISLIKKLLRGESVKYDAEVPVLENKLVEGILHRIKDRTYKFKADRNGIHINVGTDADIVIQVRYFSLDDEYRISVFIVDAWEYISYYDSNKIYEFLKNIECTEFFRDKRKKERIKAELIKEILDD